MRSGWDREFVAIVMHGKYFSFGATSAVITGLGVIVGLSGTANAVANTVTALVIIALADNISDSFGIHIHQESQKESVSEVRRVTFANFATRVFVAAMFVLLVLILPTPSAVLFSIFLGVAVITLISYYIARERNASPSRIVAQHLLLTLVVIVASFLLRELSSRLVLRLMP